MKRKSSLRSHYTPKEEAERSRLAREAGHRGGKARAAKMTAEELSAAGRHAHAGRVAKQKARAGYVMERVDDSDVYISEEEFDALE